MGGTDTWPKSELGETLDYLDGQWTRLVVFLEHGEVEMTNNAAENAVRPFAVGRIRDRLTAFSEVAGPVRAAGTRCEYIPVRSAAASLRPTVPAARTEPAYPNTNAVGRKNWLFRDIHVGARASANLYGLLMTAKANRLEPYGHLRYLFEQLPAAADVADYERLLPWKVHRMATLERAM